MNDYEDALLSHCAKRVKADFIITRNTADFTNSPVNAISPVEFLSRHNRKRKKIFVYKKYIDVFNKD